MVNWLSNWQSRRRMLRLIDDATRIVYSGSYDFAEIVSHIERFGPRASIEELHLAIKAVFEIEGAFEDAVYSNRHTSDKALVSEIIDEAFKTLFELNQESDVEVRRLRKQLIETEAQHALSSLKIAFIFADAAPKDSFGNLVRQGNKIKKGPISVAQRKRFKVLAEKLDESQTTLTRLDDEKRRLEAKKEKLQAELDEFDEDELEEYEDPSETYPFGFNYHYSVEVGEALTVAEQHIIENAVNRWGDDKDYYCEIEHGNVQFVVTVWCFSDDRHNIGINLFLHLADNVFDSIGKEIGYL